MFNSAISHSTKDDTISFDYKLMFFYLFTMGGLAVFNPLDNAIQQVQLAGALLAILCIISIVHKVKHKWSWPGCSLLIIPSILFHLFTSYVMVSFVSYILAGEGHLPSISLAQFLPVLAASFDMIVLAASSPVVTPGYLAGFGILLMNIMVSVKLSTPKTSGFIAQCQSAVAQA